MHFKVRIVFGLLLGVTFILFFSFTVGAISINSSDNQGGLLSVLPPPDTSYIQKSPNVDDSPQIAPDVPPVLREKVSNLQRKLDETERTIQAIKNGGDAADFWKVMINTNAVISDSNRMASTYKRIEPKAIEIAKQYSDKASALLIQGITECDSALVAGLSSVKPPADSYKGKDRAAILAKFKAAWKEEYPEDTLLSIRLPSGWKREKGKEWNDSEEKWKMYDRSVLNGAAIIKLTDNIAAAYPIYMNKDHLSGGALVPGVSTKSGGYTCQLMLVKNVK